MLSYLTGMPPGPPMMAVPQGSHMMTPVPAQPPPEPKGKDDDWEPPNKRQKTDDEFLRKYEVSYGPTPVPSSPEPKGSLGDIR